MKTHTLILQSFMFELGIFTSFDRSIEPLARLSGTSYFLRVLVLW